MNKITLLICMLTSSTLFAQNGNITLSADTLCAGETLMATANPQQLELTTPSGTNNQNGVMFDISAASACEITGFEISPLSSGSTFYLYYRAGSHVGFESSATGWILLDSVTNVPAGTNVNPGFNFNQAIAAGQTLAFYITSNGTNYLYYDDGTAVGNTLANNGYLTIKEGVGKVYPFGSTFSPRNFVGRVLHNPLVSSYTWNTGQTTQQITLTPQRSVFLSCKMQDGAGINYVAFATAFKTDINIALQADPAVVQPGQSTTLSSRMSLDRSIATAPGTFNNQNGAMFDIDGTDSITLSGFTVSSWEDTGTTNFEVLYKTGTHVGFQGNATAWTSIGTYASMPAGDGIYLALNNPIDVLPGQTLAFYITRTDGGYLRYANGNNVGDVAARAGGIIMREGTGLVYPFGNTFSPRVISAIVHYNLKQVTNASYNWSAGGSSASVVVTPGAVKTFSLDATVNGCTQSESITIGVIGIDEEDQIRYRVYPNPAVNNLTVDLINNHKQTNVQVLDMMGRMVWQGEIPAHETTFNVPVSNLASGMYLLQFSHNNATTVYRIEKL